MKVRTNLARSKHSQWWLGHKVTNYTSVHQTIFHISDTQGHGQAGVHHQHDRHLVHGVLLPSSCGCSDSIICIKEIL